MTATRIFSPRAVPTIVMGLAAGFAMIAFLGTPGTALAQGAASASRPDLARLLQGYGFELKQEGEKRYVEVSLQQVLELALERNLSLKAVRMGESIAESELEAARDRFNPTLTNESGYTRAQTPSSFGQTDPNSPFATITGTDALTLSSTFTKPTQSGIEYSLSFTERRVRALSNSIATEGADPTGLATSEWWNTSALTGRVTVPFGQDGGSAFNSIPERRGQTGLQGSRLTIRQRERELLELTALTYWDLVAALENVRVQADAVALSEQLLRDNRQRLEAGVLSPFDVQVAEAQLARERERLLSARADVLRIEDLARALLNLPVLDFEVRPLDRPGVGSIELDYAPLLERLYASSPDVKQIENRLAANNLDLEEARNRDRTDLDLEVYYTLQGINGSPLGGVSGFSQTELDNYGAVLTWTVPLFDTVTRETIRRRTLERQQIELDLESLKSDLSVRLQGALRQIRVSREQVDTARVARQLAEEQLNNEIERFRVGESTSFQVSQSQQESAQARVQEIIAQLNLERNILQLQVLTGDIYSQYGLSPSQR